MNLQDFLIPDHTMCQQESSAIRNIAQSHPDPAQAGQKGSFKGVLEKDGKVKFFFPDQPDYAEHLAKAREGPFPFLKRHDMIHRGMGFKKGEDPWLCQNRDGT